MSAHYDASSEIEHAPGPKRAKVDDGNGGYVSAETEREEASSQQQQLQHFSLVFSMPNEKGALVGALQLCKVRGVEIMRS